MENIRLVMTFWILVLTSVSVFGQQTLEEVLDRGGKKRTVEELRSVLPGKTFIVRNSAGRNSTTVLNADGSLSGYAETPNGSLGLTGTWAIENEGQVCLNYRLSNRSIPPATSCAFHYVVGEKYFVVASDQGPAAEAKEMKFK